MTQREFNERIIELIEDIINNLPKGGYDKVQAQFYQLWHDSSKGKVD